ncbi:MAG: hypothetical protein A2898_03580 [Candidatus Kerfeldbacteria bacterium RIFCSPLOWO2_01_FULL_48_11]|uniref:Methyltransferase type 11 domain-containing protein n=1 Tax=Candidatus Kerfeldbacteria bacterium RIFCSPLOWO2_01_FULL_48_11 TaxID=1798543 RepID=A0A1G2B550_9BACT|nr:MAG: Methyltransferase type 12 [Parcubacteria group bacterium GW2011_GWA2_48_9]KKW16273.1 MAG: Methyltransferase type 12 [Parcubacteria group bacterium GW2011_GWC2_49_9]OGY83340.1 MAG: hypothetical protein A2898_03580 [Candidatus Kerfeldbacteria bacterium RIFCSPLOWO2_01_FULL_48_11]
MKLKETFGKIPQHYDKSRIGYPKKLFRDIIRYAKLAKKDPILEIGIGTGLATIPFARLGNPITANDISYTLIRLAKKKLKKYRNISYVIGQFEKARLPSNRYGLMYSAQTFHWIDPGARFSKTSRLLKKGGTLALFWNAHWYDRGVGKMALKIHNKYSRAKGGKADEIIQQLFRDRRFTNGVSRQYRFTVKITRQQYIDMQTSYSWYIALSKKRKEVALAELTDKLRSYPNPMRIPMRTKFVMARKK